MKWIAGLLTLTAATGMAQAAETPSIFKTSHVGIQLSDKELDVQRGKFTAGPNAHYFGIEFITSIPSPNGMMTSSAMQLNVSFNQNQPSIDVNVYANELESAGASQQSGAVPNGTGITQIAQVAGNANTGINDLSFQKGAMPVQGTSLSQGHYQVSLPGGIAHYEFTNDQLGMSYTSADNALNATQMVRNTNGNQGLVQHLSINGNNELLSNKAKFYVGEQLINPTDDLANTLRQQIPTNLYF